jgi:hypothetical protein
MAGPGPVAATFDRRVPFELAEAGRFMISSASRAAASATSTDSICACGDGPGIPAARATLYLGLTQVRTSNTGPGRFKLAGRPARGSPPRSIRSSSIRRGRRRSRMSDCPTHGSGS